MTPADAAPGGKAYEAVAAELLDRIVHGSLPNGARLPNETTLAEEFGVSRTTVREALRLLSAQDLIRTNKGSGGGSFVQVPSISHISDYLRSSIDVLSSARFISVEDLLQARTILEVPAARLAAMKRRDGDIERLRATIPRAGERSAPQQQLTRNRDFHSTVLDICGNALLSIAAQPIFTVLMTGFARSTARAGFQQSIRQHHDQIARAIEFGEPDAAASLMHDHLEYLRPMYEKLWQRSTIGRQQ